MSAEKSKENYYNLFSTEEKAVAFDKIAEKFYFANFGSTSKSDIETLLFSIYIEQILNRNQESMEAYSDYTLSKLLGITQSKVSNLKVRKELHYPYDKFDWKKSFMRISDRVVYEDGKIKLYIPDRNLYLELKNAIETNGGYIEAQLTSNLLQVRLPYFLDLLIAITDESDREKLKKKIATQLEKKYNDEALPHYFSFGQELKAKAPDIAFQLLESCIPLIGGPVKVIAENVYRCVSESR